MRVFIVSLFLATSFFAFAQGPLSNGARHDGAISSPFQIDSWTFHAEAGNAILLGLGELTDTSGGFTPYIQLYRPDGARVGGSAGAVAAQLSATALLSGSYRVTVSSGPGGLDRTGIYRLTLLTIPGGNFTVSPGDQGSTMTNGARHDGGIDAGDLDAWTFSASAGDRLFLSIGETADLNGFAPSIRLYRPDGVRLAESFGERVAQIEQDAPVAGVYTVVVSASAGGPDRSGSYRLTLAKAPGAFAVPDGDQGGPLQNGARNDGNLYAGDLDMWSFAANAGDRIVLSISMTEDRPGLWPYIQLFRPDGVRAAGALGPYVAQINEAAPVSGTYTVVVSSRESFLYDIVDGAGTYRLKLAKAPGAFFVSPGDQGGPLDSGVTRKGFIDTGDIDLWSFQASAGDRISARLDVTLVLGGGFYPLLQLIGPNGQRVAVAPGFDASQIVLFAPLTGTYTLLASSNFGNNSPGNIDATGGYDLRVDVQRNPPTLTAIRISSAKSVLDLLMAQQLTATASYSDGSTEDVTNKATWMSANTAIAGVHIQSGLVTGLGIGTTTLTASLLGITSGPFPMTVTSGFSITSIQPNPAVTGPNIFVITGSGFNPDNVQVEISNSATVSNSALLSKSTTRLVFALDLGRGVERVVVRNGPGGPLAVNSVTLTIADSITPAGGSHFVPIAPCRAVDTRSTTILSALTTRVFNFANCGIPTNATAVALNVTLVPSGPFGYLSIWPTGQNQPVVSTMNSLDGRVKANAAVVGLGNGSVNIFVTDSAHVVLDVNGYFVPAGTPGALAFYPIAPCRVLDSRETGGVIPAEGTRRVNGGCLPAGAQAYSLNVTVVPSGPLGFLTLWPDGLSRPTVSTLNAVTGTVVANAAILRAGTGGAIQAYVTEPSHLIVDVNGYFGSPGAVGALAFYPVQPCRMLDTRIPAGLYGSPRMEADSSREFKVPWSGCGVPESAQAYVTNATVVPPGLFGFLTLWPSLQSRPTVSTLNALDGSLTSNAAVVAASQGGLIRAYASNATDLLLDISGYFAP